MHFVSIGDCITNAQITIMRPNLSVNFHSSKLHFFKNCGAHFRHDSGSHINSRKFRQNTLKSKSSGSATKNVSGFCSVLGAWLQTVLKIRFQDWLKLLITGYKVITWSNGKEFTNILKAFLTEKSADVNHKSADDEKKNPQKSAVPRTRLMPDIIFAVKGYFSQKIWNLCLMRHDWHIWSIFAWPSAYSFLCLHGQTNLT